MLKKYNWEFDYYYDWDQVGLTNSEIKAKEKNDINIMNNNNILNSQNLNTRLYKKISNLINERKINGGSFEVDRFVFDLEEESNFNIGKMRSVNQNNETEAEYYNYTNSMTPYEAPKKRVKKQGGCIPCQPKGYKDTDNACCEIY